MAQNRIRNLEALLTSAQLLEDSQCTDLVELGSRITVASGDSVETYRLVTRAEADPSSRRISTQSPLGRALLGHSVGDQVLVQAPDGPIQWRILSIA